MILPHDPPIYNPISTYSHKPIRIVIDDGPIKVITLRLVDQRFLRAVVTVRIGDHVIRNVCVLHRRGRLCVQMPQSHHGPGLWTPAVELGTPALKAKVNDCVLEFYKAAAIVGGLAK